MTETIEQSYEAVQCHLAKWRGSEARLWEFIVSHDTLTLRLHFPDKRGNLHVICSSCLHLAAPVYWDHSGVHLEPAEPDEGGELFQLKDEKAGFLVTCRMVSVEENVAPVY